MFSAECVYVLVERCCWSCQAGNLDEDQRGGVVKEEMKVVGIIEENEMVTPGMEKPKGQEEIHSEFVNSKSFF